MRLFCGLLAGQNFAAELIGDESLSKRPMARVADPLRQMGAVIETAEGGRPPLKIQGGKSPAWDRLRHADGQRSGQVLPSAGGSLCRWHHDRARAGAYTRSHRAHVARVWLCR